MASKAAAAAEGDADFKGDGRRAHGQPRTLDSCDHFLFSMGIYLRRRHYVRMWFTSCIFGTETERREESLSLLFFNTRVAPHCVNTLMILHASHTLMMSAG